MAKLPAFYWPSRTDDPEAIKPLSQSLQELMRRDGIDHMQLSEKIKTTPGQIRGYLSLTMFPGEPMAQRLARFFKVPLMRLLKPEGEYKPYDGFRFRSGSKNPLVAKARLAKDRVIVDAPPKKMGRPKLNGHETEDSRWLLPPGVAPPHVKLETSAQHESLMQLEVKGDVPAPVAMAVVSMMNARKSE